MLKKSRLLRFFLPLIAGFLTMAALHFLTAGSILAAVCALIAPALLLYGTRQSEKRWQVFVSFFVFAASLLMMNLGYCPYVWLDVVIFSVSAIWMFPAFLADRKHKSGTRPFVTTLVFPLCWLSLYLLSTLIRLGFQYRLEAFIACFSPFAQIVSVIGTPGLLFFMLWSASVAVYVAEERKRCNIAGIVIWAAMLLACLICGVVRVNSSGPSEKTVRVCYTTTPYNGDFINYTDMPYDAYLTSARQAADEAVRENAEILVFNEEAFCIDDTDEAFLLEQMCALAKESGLHILYCEEIDDTDGSEDGKGFNSLKWITPGGEVLFRYDKHCLIPIVESFSYVRGESSLPSATVSFRAGDIKIAALICFDTNFSLYVSSIPADTQLLVAPSWDWDPVSDYHGEVARLVAIENGVSLIKDTYDGISYVFSPTGETIYTSSTDSDGFAKVHTVDVPVWNRSTVWGSLLYRLSAQIGTAFETLESTTKIQAGEVNGNMPVSTVIILSCDVMALIVMFILLYALLFENSEKDKKTRYFIICCTCTIVSLLFDIPAWFFENKGPGYDVLLYFVNVIALLASLGTVVFISFYEIEIIGRKEHISDAHAYIIMVVCTLAGILAVIGVVNGKTFSVADGVFTYGPWYDIIPAVSLAMLLYMEVVAVVNAKHLGRHSTLAFLCYMILPLGSVALELIKPEISLILPATALSSLLLYIMLQSGHVSALHLRGELLNELSFKDMMTGLQNRRAYDAALDRLATDPVVNIIFCDVNGLKYTNDTHGHAAGDEWLKRFSRLLQRHFSYDGIFRISGDEFVVLIPKLTEKSFHERLTGLHSEIASLNDIASVGYASGKGANLDALVREAENRMYEDKRRCYALHPEYKR